MEVTHKYITIKAQIDGEPKESDFELKTEPFSLSVKLGSKDVIIKNLYVSIDPYQINRMKTVSSSQKTSKFAVALAPGEVIDAYGVGKVVASGDPNFKKDDYVVGLISWAEYSISQSLNLSKQDPMGFPLSYYVGLLGLSGLTAYAGFFELCKPKKGEKKKPISKKKHVLSITICLKLDLLKEKFGFDEAFNYKEETDLFSTLERYFPDGIDIYFDNVGGEMLEAAISNMNLNGRIALCGIISEYLDGGKRATPDLLTIIQATHNSCVIIR